MEFLSCPHCTGLVEIESLNCGIFRHAHYKSGEQINPHASQQECEQLIINGSIWGCGKPFRVKLEEKKYVIEICEFI